MPDTKIATCLETTPIGKDGNMLLIVYQIGRTKKTMGSTRGDENNPMYYDDYHLAQQLKPGTKFRIATREVICKSIPGKIEILPGKEHTVLPYIVSIVKTK